MALLELYPIVVSALVWGHLWHKKRIMVNCDNQATVAVIQKGRSRCPRINALMRKLTLAAARGCFILLSQYLPSESNGISDSLSRFQMDRFRSLAPQANAIPTKIPDIGVVMKD